MLITIVENSCYAYRTDGDPVFRPSQGRGWGAPGWYAADSRMLHHVLKALRAKGFDVIKKRMWKDGHMIGGDETQYVRTRKVKGPLSFAIYHEGYATEIASENFNVLGGCRLDMMYGLDEEGEGPNTRSSRKAVEKAFRSPVYEVSWIAEATIDTYTQRHRHIRGFDNKAKALAFFRTVDRSTRRIVDVRTGKPVYIAA